MVSDKINLEKKLSELLFSNKDEIVISLKGNWGIGKTYFWCNYIENIRKTNDKLKYAYLSLFGKTSLNDITDSVILQISKKSKIVNTIEKYAGKIDFGIAGMSLNIGSAISLLKPSDFKDVIICFDDFERISSSLKLKEVLGFISELKEQKKCKIVMINNSDQLFKTDLLDSKKMIRNISKNVDIEENQKNNFKSPSYFINETNLLDIFEEYNEKIIDYELTYSPSIEENFSLVRDRLIHFDQSLLLKLLQNHISNSHNNAFNIRMMKRVIDKLNIFHLIEKFKLEQEISNSILIHVFEKIYNTSTGIRIDSIDLSLIKKDIDLALSKNYIFDNENFKKQIEYLSEVENTRKLEIDSYNLLEKAKELWNSYRYDLKMSADDYYNEIIALLKEYSEKLVHLNIVDFKFLTDELLVQKADKKSEIEKLYITTCKKYIDTIFSNKLNKDSHRLFSNDFFGVYYEDNNLKKYIEKKREILKEETVNDRNEIIKTLKKPIESRSWSPELVRFLSEIPVDTHRNYIEESSEYFEQVYDFIAWSYTFSGTNPFGKSVGNMVVALNILNSNESYKNKIDPVLEVIEKWSKR